MAGLAITAVYFTGCWLNHQPDLIGLGRLSTTTMFGPVLLALLTIVSSYTTFFGLVERLFMITFLVWLGLVGWKLYTVVNISVSLTTCDSREKFT